MTEVKEKVCTFCKIVKDLNMFRHMSGKRSHLLQTLCRDCENKNAREHYRKNRENFRAYKQKYYQDNRGECLQRRRRYYENNQEEIIKKRLRYYKENPKMSKAQYLVKRQIKKGEIKRPNTCEYCEKEGKVHAHHCDYNKPLEVIWLCPKCHKNWHVKLTPIY